MTEENLDVRSKQRFSNFSRAFQLYVEAVGEGRSRLEEEGIIQRFEYSFELAWKFLQDVLQERGYSQVRGPRPAIEQAFQDGLINDGLVWLDMLKARNETTHLYSPEIFDAVIKKVKGPFLAALEKLFHDFGGK